MSETLTDDDMNDLRYVAKYLNGARWYWWSSHDAPWSICDESVKPFVKEVALTFDSHFHAEAIVHLVNRAERIVATLDAQNARIDALEAALAQSEEGRRSPFTYTEMRIDARKEREDQS